MPSTSTQITFNLITTLIICPISIKILISILPLWPTLSLVVYLLLPVLLTSSPTSYPKILLRAILSDALS